MHVLTFTSTGLVCILPRPTKIICIPTVVGDEGPMKGRGPGADPARADSGALLLESTTNISCAFPLNARERARGKFAADVDLL